MNKSKNTGLPTSAQTQRRKRKSLENFILSKIMVLFVFCAAAPIAASAQTLTTIADFTFSEGMDPDAPLVQGINGNLYGTTAAGGSSTRCRLDGQPYGCGTLFEITPAGTLTTVHRFDNADGDTPGGLVQAANGSFYGTTFYGGANGGGTVFNVSSTGKLTTLYSFCSQTNCIDGKYPTSQLVLGINGNFYGATYGGGANGGGTIFQVTPGGNLITLYSFCSQTNCNDGSGPGGLMLATSGAFYGVTSTGGANLGGTIFEITPAGKLSTLYSFCSQSNCTDGYGPSTVVQVASGVFYGITNQGGANCLDGLPSGCGTVFEITPKGVLKTLYSFCSQTNCSDGSNPNGLIQATDGNLYGTTSTGGLSGNWGTIFEITAAGTLTTLHQFCSQTNCEDGAGPQSGLMQATDGSFYGTTGEGGSDCIGAAGCGSVFSLSMGLSPFVEALPNFGKAGGGVGILGSDLTGAISVSFNGTPATDFTVISATVIKATVPLGATTGTIDVTTPTGTLSSNVPFRILR
jgi:uncharacterized repeat protein (TIGR03803 family)